MPTVVRKDINNNAAQVTVTITRDEIEPKINAELKRFRQRAGIKGFRQGQAPMPYIKKMFGSSILVDTFNDMMAQAVYDYLKDSQIDVLGQPLPVEDQQRYNFKIDQIEPEYSVVYDIGYVAPFDLQGLSKDQQFERLTVSDIETLIDDDLEYARNRMGKQSNPEDGILENDILRINSKEVDGDYATTITVLVKDVIDEDLKKTLLGSKKGDTVRFNARHIETPKAEHLYRKYVLSLPDNDERQVGDIFEGVIEEISRTEPAELDEEFYKNYFGGKVSNLEEARETIKAGIQRFYEVRSSALLMREFQNRLMELNKIDLPDAFLKRWLLVSNEGKISTDQIEREYSAFADNLRWSLIRDKIKAKYGIEVSDAEVREEYAQKVRNYFQMELPDHIIESSIDRLMADKNEVEETFRNLETEKIFQAILQEVSTTEKAVPSKELHNLLDAVTNKQDQSQIPDAAVEATVVE